MENEMLDKNRLPDLYEASRLLRWHTHQLPISQNLADHSYGVALIISIMHPNPSVKLLKAALWHDLHESVLGDWPHSAKTENPALAEFEEAFERKFRMEHGIDYQLEADEQLWLTFADRLESFYFLSSVLFLSPKLMEIRIEALTLAEETVKALQSFGYFLDPEETMN
jgi:5'-deoxynucleotidase YfbR-like HD superfamily hydrolase